MDVQVVLGGHGSTFGADGTGCVVGVDPAPAMVAMARALCPDASFHEAGAASLPFAAATFDAVTASQVLCFVPDVAAALAELRRVLRPGGRVVLLDTDWDTLGWHCTDAALRQRVVAELTRGYASAQVPKRLAAQLAAAGFDRISCVAHPIVNLELEEASYSGQLLGFLPDEPADGQGRSLRDAWAADIAAVAGRGEYFFSLNRYQFSAWMAGC